MQINCQELQQTHFKHNFKSHTENKCYKEIINRVATPPLKSSKVLFFEKPALKFSIIKRRKIDQISSKTPIFFRCCIKYSLNIFFHYLDYLIRLSVKLDSLECTKTNIIIVFYIRLFQLSLVHTVLFKSFFFSFLFKAVFSRSRN